MPKMAHIDCIRTLRQWEGKGVSEISRIMGVDWRTAKKYADFRGAACAEGAEAPEAAGRRVANSASLITDVR